MEITASWTRTLQMDKLLLRIAEAATKLLGAERASIFLWDRATRTLVGESQQQIAHMTSQMQETLSVSGALLVKTFGLQLYGH